MQVLYLAHDLNDAAIWRRAEMLRRGGATVTVAGFRRHDGALAGPAQELGRTQDGNMAQRLRAVLRLLPRPEAALDGGPDGALAGVDVILARNLEMLVLGARLQRRAAPQARLVYELLDVHRLLSAQGGGVKGLIGRGLRAVERRALRQAAGLIYSSDGFRRLHPAPFAQIGDRARLVENKPLAPEPPLSDTPAPADTAPGPIRIGWFGILRCAWSLAMLDALTRGAPGRWQVTLRGRAALDQIPEFHSIVAANPDLAYHGPYRAPEDLPAIYGAVDLAWLIDRFEAGGNSDWLLPNRLYEGGLTGTPPIVLAGTEVARRAGALGIGLDVARPDAPAIRAALAPCTPARIAALRLAVARHPRATWQADGPECRALTNWLAALDPAATACAPQPAAELVP